MEEAPSRDMQSRLAHGPQDAVGRRGSHPTLGSVPCPQLGLMCAWAAQSLVRGSTCASSSRGSNLLEPATCCSRRPVLIFV